MSEPELQHPLTDRALSQLRKLAQGNGITPEKIALIKTEERTYALNAVLSMAPSFEAKSLRYAGRASGKDRQSLPTFASLHEAAKEKQKAFSADPANWMHVAIAELKTQPGEGWGLHEAKVTLPNAGSTILAATEACPRCHGQQLIPCANCRAQGSVLCHQCQGRGREFCYECHGTGQNSTKPGERCFRCEGAQYAPCRNCTVRNYHPGFMPCQVCQGRRGVSCPDCRGTGFFTEEITLEIAVITHFRLKTAGLPVGLNRMLDRLGIINLVKGHADIETYVPDEDEDIETRQKHTSDGALPALYYRAQLPYADVRLNLSGRIVTFSVFGKRGILLGVPPFLDNALMLARDHLARAAKGSAEIEAAITARCIRDALTLQLAGKGTATDLRRLYPVGLSTDTANEIVINTRRALNRTTLSLRMLTAGLCVALAASGFYGILFTPLYAGWTKNMSLPVETALDIVLPLAPMLLGWIVLGLAVRTLLGSRFRGIKFAFWQKTGKTGYAMLATILLAYGVILALAPVKPSGFSKFIH